MGELRLYLLFLVIDFYLRKEGGTENEKKVGCAFLFRETFCRELKQEERKSENFLTFEKRFEGVWVIKK